jgi:hypothetical protein
MLDLLVLCTGQAAVDEVRNAFCAREIANTPEQLVVLQTAQDRQAVVDMITNEFKGVVVSILSYADYLAQSPDLMEDV